MNEAGKSINIINSNPDSKLYEYKLGIERITMEKAISTMVKTEQTKIGMLAEKEKEITQLWHQIPCFFTKSNEPECEKFQMLQGSSRIHSKMQNMISNSKIGCKLLCGAKDLSRFYYSNLIEIFEASSSNMKLIISYTRR